MQPHPQSTPLTATFVLAGTALVLAVSLALITASLFMLKYLLMPNLIIPTSWVGFVDV